MAESRRAVIFSVVNQKGGVGKTTTAVNLSASLAAKGHATLLIDLDPQANASSGIGINLEAVSASVYDVLVDADTIQDALYPTAFEGLHVLPASKSLAGAEVELVGEVSRETVLKSRLEMLRPYYDYIVIDCPPSLGLLTVNALVGSDKVVVPVQCEYYALEGIAGLVQTLTRIKENYNSMLEIVGIVLTMYDGRTSLNRLVVDNTRRFFGELVFDTVVPRNIRLSEAPSHGIPISLYSPDSKGALAYGQLTEEVLNRVQCEVAEVR